VNEAPRVELPLRPLASWMVTNLQASSFFLARPKPQEQLIALRWFAAQGRPLAQQSRSPLCAAWHSFLLTDPLLHQDVTRPGAHTASPAPLPAGCGNHSGSLTNPGDTAVKLLQRFACHAGSAAFMTIRGARDGFCPSRAPLSVFVGIWRRGHRRCRWPLFL